MKKSYALAIRVSAAASVVAASVLMSGSANAVNAEEKARATKPDSAAVERSRKAVQTLDNIFKQTIVLVTDKYVHDEDDFAAGSAAVLLFKNISESGDNKVRLIDATVVVDTVCSDEPAVADSQTLQGNATRSADTKSNEQDGLSLEAARDRAQVMHDVYAATLEVLHHRYFHRDRAIIPARAMQDIFDEIERQSKTEARWISASMKPMSVDHEPTSDFEKRAAKEIAAGTEQLEVVEDGYYRRAGAILLSDGCVGCHGGFFKPQSKTPKFAGLVISVPIRNSHPVESK